MKIELVKNELGDLQVISEIYIAEFSREPYNEIWTYEKALAKMKFFQEFYDLYNIKVDGNIVGLVVVNPNFMCPGDVAFIEEIAIMKNMQCNGVGEYVINKIIAKYKNNGFNKLMCIVNIKSGVCKFYEKIGLYYSKSDTLMEMDLK